MASSRLFPAPMLLMRLFLLFFFASQVFAISAVLGVDLGTEYIKAALVQPGAPIQIVLTKDSRRKEVSAVAFKALPNGARRDAFPERAYGSDAMALAPRFPHDVYPNLKLLIGQLADSSPIVREYAASHPGLHLQHAGDRGTVSFKSDAFAEENQLWMVEELLAMQLQSIQRNAETAGGTGTVVRSIVLTVPAFFTMEEKRAVQTAAEMAGLKVLSLISEGLAVGLHYATTHQSSNINEGGSPEYHIVFDMGAGSSKATVMKFLSKNVKDVGKLNKTVQEVQVVGSSWDRSLGGYQLNQLIIDDMIARFVQSPEAQAVAATTDSIKAHGRTMAKLSKEAERIRQVLSANTVTQSNMEGLYEDVDFRYKISRVDFEKMSEEHGMRVADVVKKAINSAQLDVSDISSLILHGGATRTPFVQRQLEEAMGSADKVRSSVNADEAAALGAGFRAAELSPSFKVKEIRPLEGNMYPSSMRWSKNGREHHQRLWSSHSPLGGALKEVTFSSVEELELSFYQQIEAGDRDVNTMATTNLTATIAEMVNERGCPAAEISVKVGLKLKSENGEILVITAHAECEIEAKDSFVSGVKNLFGFGGKKNQQPIDEVDGQNEREDDATASSSQLLSSTLTMSKPSSTSSTSSSISPSASVAEPLEAGIQANNPKHAKNSLAAKQIITIPLEIEVGQLGILALSRQSLQKIRDRLKAFDASDSDRLLREESLNKLEAFTYKVRDLLGDEAFIAASTSEERDSLDSTTRSTNEWLYGDGIDASKDVIKKRLDELNAIADPIQYRIQEAAQRPMLIAGLRSSLNSTATFLDMLHQQITDYEQWQQSVSASTTNSPSSVSAPESEASQAKDFEGLEDENDQSVMEDLAARKLEDAMKSRGPIPPLYNAEDVAVIAKQYEEVLTWLDEMERLQAKIPVTQDPLLTAKALKARREQLDQAGIELAMRGVKSFGKKAKKASTEQVLRMKKTRAASAAGPEKSSLANGKVESQAAGQYEEAAKFEKQIKDEL